MIKRIIVHNPGPGPVLVALWDELKIGKTIDSLTDWDETQCKLSPGTRIKAMVLNILYNGPRNLDTKNGGSKRQNGY